MANISVFEIVEDGKILEAAELISVMELFIKEVKSNPDYINAVCDEVAKYGKSKETETMKIELAEVGTKYNFDLCGDPLIKELNFKLDLLESEIYERKEFLKKLPQSGMETILDDEVVKLFPPVKTSTSSYKTTIKK